MDNQTQWDKPTQLNTSIISRDLPEGAGLESHDGRGLGRLTSSPWSVRETGSGQ